MSILRLSAFDIASALSLLWTSIQRGTACKGRRNEPGTCLCKEPLQCVLMPVQVAQRGEGPKSEDFPSSGAVSSLLEQLQSASSELSGARAALEAALQERPAAAPATDNGLATSKHWSPTIPKANTAGVDVHCCRLESAEESAYAATSLAITALKHLNCIKDAHEHHAVLESGLAVQVDQAWKIAQVTCPVVCRRMAGTDSAA